MTDEIEKMQLKQKGQCRDCGKSFMNGDDQGGLKCWGCNKLYCNSCYKKTHIIYNMKMWETKEADSQ